VSIEANMYHAIYLHAGTTKELMQKLLQIPSIAGIDGSLGLWQNQANSPSRSNHSLAEEPNFKLFISGPNNILVLINDEVLSNIKDESLFHLDVNPSKGNIIMKSVLKNNAKNEN
jgi:hypothetical protein